MTKRAALPDQHSALLRGEDTFRTLVERGTDAIQLLDAQGSVLYSGKSVEEMFGYTAEELKGTKPSDFIHPEDFPYFRRRVSWLAKRPGNRIQMEYRVRHKSGKWLWVETQGVNYLDDPSVRALVGEFRDITKRKQVEQALAESEARFRFMAESMPQKIFTVDAKGKPDYFSPQWTEFTGISLNKPDASLLQKIIHPDDYPETVKVWRHSVETGEDYTIEQRLRAADGKYRWHLSRMRAMRDKKNDIVMWIGSSTDIDDVKQAHQREARLEHKAMLLAEQRKQLIKLNKTKDEFISLASHQLRTPATGVKQYLGMILEGYLDVEVPEPLHKMIQTAYESNERQLKVVNDLLRVASIDAGKLKVQKQTCDIITLLKDVIRDYQHVFEGRHQQLEYKRYSRAKYVHADTGLVRMVLENILDNASKYTPEGKTIHVSDKSTKKYIFIVIRDEGVGISAADQANLFKKFSRIDNPLSAFVGGSGLGLYWAQQVIELHGGSIKVQSDVDAGSTFTIKLPLASK